MENPVFSIIVPIYKVEKYIEKCIDSILNQSFSDFELILIDDGSPDNCPGICDEYALSDSRVRVVHKKNGGLVNARKSGAELCRGKYVINIDGDDYIAEGALDIIANICQTNNVDVVCYGIERIGNCKEIVHNAFDEALYDTPKLLDKIFCKLIYDWDKPFYSFGIHPSLCNKAIKRDLYIKYQQMADSRISMGEDFMVTLPVILASNSIYVTDEIFYFYRGNSSSMVNNYRKTEFNELLYLLDYVKRYVSRDRDVFEPQMDAYIYHRLNNIFTCESMSSKSIISSIKTLSTYYKQIKKYISGRDIKSVDLKFKIIKFAIDKKWWFYFFLNARRIKLKNKNKPN